MSQRPNYSQIALGLHRGTLSKIKQKQKIKFLSMSQRPNYSLFL